MTQGDLVPVGARAYELTDEQGQKLLELGRAVRVGAYIVPKLVPEALPEPSEQLPALIDLLEKVKKMRNVTQVMALGVGQQLKAIRDVLVARGDGSWREFTRSLPIDRRTAGRYVKFAEMVETGELVYAEDELVPWHRNQRAIEDRSEVGPLDRRYADFFRSALSLCREAGDEETLEKVLRKQVGDVQLRELLRTIRSVANRVLDE